MAEPRKTVFVSYAHEDRKWAEALSTFLAPWIRDKRLNLWDDSKIQSGQQWRAEIETALDEASVAVLLVTPSFFNSDFVMNHELPVLLDRAGKQQLRLIWVAVEHSGYASSPLAPFQAVNDPQRPLEMLSKPRRNEAMVEIARRIADAVTIGTFAGGLQIVDATTEPMQAAVERRSEVTSRSFGVQAVYEPERDRISFTGATETITVADLVHLAPEDREFIADLEDSLVHNYQRWKLVRARLGNAGGALDGEVEEEVARITKLICRDLNSILDFLRDMYKYQLQDHYGRYRFICQQLGAPA